MTAQPAREPFSGRVTHQAMGAPLSASTFSGSSRTILLNYSKFSHRTS